MVLFYNKKATESISDEIGIYTFSYFDKDLKKVWTKDVKFNYPMKNSIGLLAADWFRDR